MIIPKCFYYIQTERINHTRLYIFN